MLSSKNNKRYSKNCRKIKYVYLNEVIYLITIKMRQKMENGSHKYDLDLDMGANILNIKCASA